MGSQKRQKNKTAHNIFQPGWMWESSIGIQNGVSCTYAGHCEGHQEALVELLIIAQSIGLNIDCDKDCIFFQVLCLKIFPWLTPALEVIGAHVTEAASPQAELSELSLHYWGHSLRDTVKKKKKGTTQSRQLVLVQGVLQIRDLAYAINSHTDNYEGPVRTLKGDNGSNSGFILIDLTMVVQGSE